MTPIEVYNQWHDYVGADMYEYIDYLRGIAKGNILEIGVREGVSTACFLLGLEQNGGHLWSVDIDPKCNVFDHPQWSFINADSNDFPKVIQSLLDVDEFDILLIDGDHRSPAVDNDLSCYAPLVRDGGLILMHDIIPPKHITEEEMRAAGRDGWGTPDVRRAYDRYIAETGYQHVELPGQFGLGVITKCR